MERLSCGICACDDPIFLPGPRIRRVCDTSINCQARIFRLERNDGNPQKGKIPAAGRTLIRLVAGDALIRGITNKRSILDS